MCKTKMSVNASTPTQSPRSSRTPRSSRATQSSTSQPHSRSHQPSKPTSGSGRGASSSSASEPSTSTAATSANYTGTSYVGTSKTSSLSSFTSLSSLRDSLPETPQVYDFSEICAATNNFLAKKLSSSAATPSWRCTLRGKDVVISQRKFKRSLETSELREKLSLICKSHHISIVKLLGVSVSGEHLYSVYEFVASGASLADVLKNTKNPNFTVLSTWISRMQVATDVADGLDYIHNHMCLVHNHVKSSSIIVTEPSFKAKICHFGAAQLCGETVEIAIPQISSQQRGKGKGEIEELGEERSGDLVLKRSDSRKMQFEGVRGYMSAEFQSTGVGTQKSDVYAFGVVILELLSGEESLKFKYDKRTGDFIKTSVIETAIEAIEGGNGAGVDSGRLRKWVDRRLKDSFPVEVVEKVTRIALECVQVDPDKRPDMRRVAGKISKLYLESRIWSDKVRVPTGISVSLAPR